MKITNKILALALMAAAMAFASCSKDDNDPLVPTQQEIEAKIVGKWKYTERFGKECITNNRNVWTFMNQGKGEASISKNINNGWIWANKESMTYQVNLNHVTLSIDKTVLHFAINSIDENGFSYTVEEEGASSDSTCVFLSVRADFSHDIIGMWEGTAMTGYETYGDYHHRIEYRADGTYTYYSWDESTQAWQPLEDVMDEWNVDGDWLATRWQNKGSDVMNYEWWDIDYIKDGMMKWSALREKEDGTRFTTTFTWKKVK